MPSYCVPVTHGNVGGAVAQNTYFEQARVWDGNQAASYGTVLTELERFQQLPVSVGNGAIGVTAFPVTLRSIRLQIARTGTISGATYAYFSIWRYTVPGADLTTNPANFVDPSVEAPLCTATIPLASLPVVSAADNGTFLNFAGTPVMPYAEVPFDTPAVFTAPTVSDQTSQFFRWALYLDNGFAPVSGIVLETRTGVGAPFVATADSLDPGPIVFSFASWPGPVGWFQGPGAGVGTVAKGILWWLCYTTDDIIGPEPGSGSTTVSWGYNGFGQLALGDTTDVSVPTPLATDVSFEDVVASFATSWGRTSVGNVYGWGLNDSGQIGNGLVVPVTNPVPILLQSLSGISFIAAGGETESGGRCFALDSSGTLYGWGDNSYGALGDGSAIAQRSPIAVNSDVTRVASGGFHTVIIRPGGTVQSVGRGDSGQLGNGSTNTTNTSWQTVTPAGAVLAVEVACGMRTTWLLMSDGTVLGAGRSNVGQLGVISASVSAWSPLPITGVVRIGTSGDTLYMVLQNGTVWAIGSNEHGVLGTGQDFPFSSATPQQMALPVGVTFTQIANTHPTNSQLPAAIALGSDALAYTWGEGTFGQRGDGTAVFSTNAPNVVPNLEGVRWVGGGGASMFADTGGAPSVVTSRGRTTAQIIG